jgi:hypothetical protein
MKRILTIGLTLFILAACESYDEKFQKVAIGNSSASVIEALGEPDNVSSVEAPFMSVQHYTWSSEGRVYRVTVAMDRVMAKTIE